MFSECSFFLPLNGTSVCCWYGPGCRSEQALEATFQLPSQHSGLEGRKLEEPQEVD